MTAAMLALALLADGRGWTAIASEQVTASLRRDADGSLCLEYDFHSVSGYAVMRRPLPMSWPKAFALHVRMKGRGGVNDFQLKLADASGDNVWWVNRPNQPLPRTLTDVTFKSRHFSFAWGPASDRTLTRTATVELAIAAGRDGGKGALCITQISFEEREADPAVWPQPVVLRDGDVDFMRLREFNGIALERPQRRYEVFASADARRWKLLRSVRRGSGAFDALYLPGSEARYLRVRPAAASVALEQWPDLNAMLSDLARHSPRGHVPRAFLGEQNYWTLVGVDGGGERSALLSEDGAVEIGRGGFSVEPAVLADGQIVTWAGVQIGHSLRDGIPRVTWRHALFMLEIEAAADGPAPSPRLSARYTLTHTSARELSLLLAVRPWQVNPPQQFLNTPGGASSIERLQWQAPRLLVNGKALTFMQSPARVTGLPFESGVDLRALLDAGLLRELSDSQAHASALLRFQPGVLEWSAPLAGDTTAADARHTRPGGMELILPAEPAIADTLKSSLAAILTSRDRAALRPGTRSYARTWIRDGAMMVAGLLRMGEPDAARDFVDWFAPYVFPSGKVPCCVDARGADPVVENDSHGEYLYAVAEVWRYSRDEAFLARHWPVVQRVVAALEALRQSTRTAALAPNLRGLMPPSISHEGYSDKPAYSYWDDFWALRGYKDAVVIAQGMGQPERAAQWARWRDEMDSDLASSIEATAKRFGMDVIAGAADRGDFDATSTTIALDPAQARVPLLKRTFERYWQEAQQRASGARPWKDYTPYELRTVGALVRLGHPDRAHEVLEFLLQGRRPPEWNQWAEVVGVNPREPRFIGDLPHAWVASDYIRSVLDMFAYEREADGAIVVGAGLSERWMASGVTVKDLVTPHGRLSYQLAPAQGGYALELSGGDGLRLSWPLPGPLPRAIHDGIELPWAGRELVLPKGPATVRLALGAGP